MVQESKYIVRRFRFDYDDSLDGFNVYKCSEIEKISPTGLTPKKRWLVYGENNDENIIVWKNMKSIPLKILKVEDIRDIILDNFRIKIFFDNSYRILIFKTIYECNEFYNFIYPREVDTEDEEEDEEDEEDEELRKIRNWLL